jgi:hypothetical protein
MRALAVLVAVAGCSEPTPSCDVVERVVTSVAAEEDRALADRTQIHGPPNARFVPLFGDYARTLGQRCRSGELGAEARRCFASVRSGADIDRCAHRHGL